MNVESNERLMRLAMEQAALAIQEGNSPFGAVLADLDGNVVDQAHNTVNADTDPTAHAEINLIRQVAKKISSKDLGAYCLVSNAQSCPMCFSAAIKAKITHFVYGYAEDATLMPQIDVHELGRRCGKAIDIQSGVLGDECQRQLERARKR